MEVVMTWQGACYILLLIGNIILCPIPQWECIIIYPSPSPGGTSLCPYLMTRDPPSLPIPCLWRWDVCLEALLWDRKESLHSGTGLSEGYDYTHCWNPHSCLLLMSSDGGGGDGVSSGFPLLCCGEVFLLGNPHLQACLMGMPCCGCAV